MINQWPEDTHRSYSSLPTNYSVNLDDLVIATDNFRKLFDPSEVPAGIRCCQLTWCPLKDKLEKLFSPARVSWYGGRLDGISVYIDETVPVGDIKVVNSEGRVLEILKVNI